MPDEIKTQRHPVDVIEALLILLSPKREEEYIDRNEELPVTKVGINPLGDLMEEEVEEVVEEVVVGVKRKAEEETEPRKTKNPNRKRVGIGFAWTEEEDDALLKGVAKYGVDYARIVKEDNGNVLGDRTPGSLQNRLFKKYPAKYKAATPKKGKNQGNNQHLAWSAEEDAALKRLVEEHGTDWKKIHNCAWLNMALEKRTKMALKNRYNHNLKKNRKK
ncbi:hypothetical protein TrST_g12096 [Triparma strigata]|uniref:Myb-like domain-containing protein n=1 Tax=Triparma strigata TaxID=1606541 RepID=A0A9W7BM36_9STRA|nr:hypothetical protein TrST_g12096 [Triparma strigata]